MSSDAIPFCDLAVPGVRDLQPYQPGKPEAELAREYGVSDIVKLASNENPLGPGEAAVAAARDAVTGVHRYPEGSAHALRHAVARHHDVAPECITFGNGSNDVLDLLARAFLGPGREAVFSQHAFAVYAIATRTVGAEAVVAAANAADHPQPYGHDPEALLAGIGGQTRVLFIANPNNPTGTWLDGDTLESLIARVPREVVVVLDEAYVDYARDCTGYVDGRRWLETYPNLVITRTFSKIHGLAGLRAGYALSSPEIADLLNRARHPFNLNSVAQAAAEAALTDTDHVDRSVALNSEQREWLRARLEGLGLTVLPSAGNFLAVEVGDDAGAVNEALLRRGVIVRPIGGYGLPRFLRVTVGTAGENARFVEALGEALSGERA
ncbi:Histidinol-phosphate aminotransferase [wastewater metagenome]|uniref:Histidinol-phosphate aminotransferase n=2 Tax=unclassified sequences TaxID=12908 RepID=A0A5B8RBQ9_9ZZZZ|nr:MULTISPECIES: histidinol-phosphate transaminase [Arhodomonas]MCS4505037.1 histidinol-phosphate transaminase [Arhodomonas aquaeolei]QEA06071.1 histidinol-phosphate aminotransferase [uncultured organism]